MKLQLKFLTLFVLTTFCISCETTQDSNPPQCDSTNTEFNQIFTSLLNIPTNLDIFSVDLNIHTYTFEVLSNKTICQIGYQSPPNFNSTPYTIEIFNNTTNTLLYSGNHTFSLTATSYESITPVPVQVGHSYTIKRIQNNANGSATNLTGRIVLNGMVGSDGFGFPLIFGALKITSASFYDITPMYDNPQTLPYVDIVFQN